MRLKAGMVAGVLACVTVMSVFATAQTGYKMTAEWKVGGDGGWDYLAVDPVTNELYVTRGAHVMAMDTATGKVVADITGFKGTHGVVFSNDGKTGYISDGRSNEVAVFDRASHAVTAKVATGANPDGMVFDDFTQTVWAFNGTGKSATVIDAKTNAVVATIPLPGKPEFPVTDGKGSIFVNIEDKNQIVHLDAVKKAKLAEWSIAPCDSPSGQAVDVKANRLFSVCDGGVMTVTDAATGKVVATPKIGDGPDAAWFDAKTGFIFSSNGQSGTLTIVHEDSADKYTTVDTVKTAASGRTMALDGKTGKVYVAVGKFGPRPAPTAENPHPWPTLIPGSFEILVVSR
jgi:YVTN family beta-propeller protein